MVSITAINGSDVVKDSRSVINTNFTNLKTSAEASEANITTLFNLQQGYMLNGKIVTSVATGNLTVAIKTLAGADPSSSDPVKVRIGNSVRTIISALSLTINAGTNTFNAGSSELATQEIDYFVYLGWRASNSSVFLGVSRIPYPWLCSQFSSTANNEKYLAYTGTTPAYTDEVEVVGRFNAILSGGAGYTWSIPGTSIIFSRPIYRTRTLYWTQTFAGFSANPTGKTNSYYVDNYRVYVDSQIGSAGTSNATSYTETLPFASYYALKLNVTGWSQDNGTGQTTNPGVSLSIGSNIATLYKDPNGPYGGSAWTNVGNKMAQYAFNYVV